MCLPSWTEKYINEEPFITFMETITISKEEYDYLKRLEQVAQEELLLSIRRGLEDAAHGRVRER